MNILFVNPFGIGDCLFASPLLHSLKDAFPQDKIGFLCNKRTYPLLKSNPFIDEIFIYERDEFKRLQSASWISWLKEFSGFIKRIKKAKFDLAIDLSLTTPFGFFLFLAGIKKRLGYNYKNRGIFLTQAIALSAYEEKHMVEYYNSLLDLIHIKPRYASMELYLDPEDISFAENLLKEENINSRSPIIAIAPGGGASWGKEAYLKYWPAESFKALIRKIIAKHDATIIIVGDSSDKELFFCHREPRLVPSEAEGRGEAIFRIIDLRGQATLAQSAALIKKSDLFIGNDGGLLHMAVALGKKTISFFGPVDPRVYGPYPPEAHRHIVLRKAIECSPCYRGFRLSPCEKDRECLVSINVEEALSAVNRLLANEDV